jgi:hypothetical protein
MQYLQPLITLDFWFASNPPLFVRPVFIGLGILLIVLFAAGAAVKYLSYRSRKNPPLHRVLSRVGRAVLTVSFTGLVLYFLSYEQIPYVSARYWWILLFALAAVWTVLIAMDFLKNFPLEKRALLEKQAKEKYLP